jgi:hypothetical protein
LDIASQIAFPFIYATCEDTNNTATQLTLGGLGVAHYESQSLSQAELWRHRGSVPMPYSDIDPFPSKIDRQDKSRKPFRGDITVRLQVQESPAYMA